MTFITSDLHFGHENIIKYCNRKFETVKEMDEKILQQFDELPDDCTIINLGDFVLNSTYSFDKLKYFVQRMKHVNHERRANRKLIMVLGNHDKDSPKYYKLSSYYMYKDLGFDKVYEFPIIVDKYIFSHEPIYLNDKSNFINIHGHVHNIDVDKDYFNRDCENWAMMEVVKKFAISKQTNLDIDTSIKRKNKTIDVSMYKNICWDKYHRILNLGEVCDLQDITF